ncbi:HEAT repeat domain-containing protein [Tamaricihabitans halophyticus]|uniref:HEAT repeat domain-containing protein n=1 Tax=Tamaricihabitans halophyticus TaxID=1262583 RepID=UPI001048EFFD|nr:HEAT repeat domain-containing protein [Tamaricihabitans halophyticus]
MTELGDGGAGPGFGLPSLSDAYAIVNYDNIAGQLAAPSPLRSGVRYRDDWWDNYTDSGPDPVPHQGTIAVAHHGCDSYTVLIVTGTARGRLAMLDFTGVPGPYVLEDDDFLSWYERWLDELAAGYRIGLAEGKIPGDQQRLVDILVTDANAARRARAARSMLAFDDLRPATVAALANVAVDPAPEVRAEAMRVAAARVLTALVPVTRDLFNDPNATVRLAAFDALSAFGQVDLPALARRLLDDSSAEARTRAIRWLSDADELSGQDLAPLCMDPDVRMRRTAVHHLFAARGARVPGLLANALTDAQPLVRLAAVQAIGRRAEAGLRGQLIDALATETDAMVRTNLQRVLADLATR